MHEKVDCHREVSSVSRMALEQKGSVAHIRTQTSNSVNNMTHGGGIPYRVEKPHLTDDDAYDGDLAIASVRSREGSWRYNVIIDSYRPTNALCQGMTVPDHESQIYCSDQFPVACMHKELPEVQRLRSL